MAAPLLPREEVVDRLLAVFRRLGYEGASLSELSKATGLGRSSLYHYFPGGKEDMARATLERLGEWVDLHLLQPLRSSGTPEERLDRVKVELDVLYASGQNACLLGTLVHGESRHLFQAQLRASFTALIEAFADLVIETGVDPLIAKQRSEDAVMRIQGALILSGGLDDSEPFRRVIAHLSKDLLRGSSNAMQ
jgi:TetR/AcrR family transcriptional regulator, lmrAB and yxaGH operons repressor